MKNHVTRLLAALLAFVVSIDGAGAALERVRIGVVHDAGSGPMFIALAKGYFANEGLDAQLQFFDSDALVPGAVDTGKADLGVTSLTASFFDFSARHGLRMFASQETDQSGYPGTTLVIGKNAYAAGLHTWKDLKGKRLGMTGTGSGSYYAFAQIAKKYGFDPRGAKLVWLQTPAKQAAALSRGQIDAALLPASFARLTRASGKGVVIRGIGDEVPWQKSVVFARAQTIHDNRTLVEKFVRAYQRGAADYDQTFLQRDDGGDTIAGPHYDEYLMLVARYANIAPEVVEPVLPWCDRDARLYVTDIQKQLEFWQREGKVDKSVSAADLLDLSFIPEHIGALQ